VPDGEILIQYCPACEAELTTSAHFCSRCGHALTATNIVDGATNVGQSPQADVQIPDVSITAPRMSVLYYKILGKLPLPVQRVIAALLSRARDPKPEETSISHTSYQKAGGSRAITWGWLSMLTLTSALGLLSVSYSYTSLRFGATTQEIFFWLGILLIFVPSLVRLILPAASRFERISLLCVVGICLYLVFVIYSPLTFSPHDAFLHWRSAEDIASSHHLFTKNSLLPASPFYPGLEIMTNALSTVSRLPIFQAGIILVGVARLVMILSLFLLYELLTKSARIAGIATILYMANPHFVFFDADYSYESLALPIATFMLFTIASAIESNETPNNNRRAMLFVAWIALCAIVVTHHMTDYFFDGLLILWTVICLFQRHASKYRSNLIMIALFGICASLAWISLKGNPVVDYLSTYYGRALDELGHILTGTSSARQLFADYSGTEPTPLWERLITIFSVLLIFSCLPFGLLCLVQRYRRNSLAYMLAIASLLYPISHVFRFTNFGSEITDRAAAFLFIPLAFVLAIFITQFWPTRWLSRRQISLITCAISIIFLGGIISPPWQLLPGPYLVSADPRSIEPQGIQAALWTVSQLGPNNRIAADRINGLLMDTYGDQYILSSLAHNIDVMPVFFSSRLDSSDVSLLRQAKIRYIVVDLRLTKALPTIGFYFEPGEPGSFQDRAPLSPQYFTKFNTISKIDRVFDSGDIIIYDVGELVNAP